MNSKKIICLSILCVFAFSLGLADENEIKCKNALICFNMGNKYYFGLGQSKDYEKAKKYFEKSCELKSADACFNLGVMYHNGKGVKQDFHKAKEFYQKSRDLK